MRLACSLLVCVCLAVATSPDLPRSKPPPSASGAGPVCWQDRRQHRRHWHKRQLRNRCMAGPMCCKSDNSQVCQRRFAQVISMFPRAGSSLRGVTDWFSRVGRTLKVAFPTANVKVRRQPDAGSVAVLSGAQGVGYRADSLVMPRCRSLIAD